MKYYFKNLWRAIRGKTGFHLVGSSPNTWYRITEMSGVNCQGHLLTNDDSCFIPFIQVDKVVTWDKPQGDTIGWEDKK